MGWAWQWIGMERKGKERKGRYHGIGHFERCVEYIITPLLS
jgi:hypothetical protein